MYTGAEFVLDASSYSIAEDGGSQSVAVQIANSVVIVTNIEVRIETRGQTANGRLSHVCVCMRGV